MSKGNESFDKLFNIVPGYIFGLISFIVGLLGNIVALLTTPDYIMWQSSISQLGLLAGGIFLRIGLIVSNFLAIPFFIYLGRAVKDDNVNKNIVKISIGSGVFSTISVILTEAFTGTDPLIRDLHGIFAFLSWVGGAATCLLFGFLMLKNSNFTKAIALISLIIGGIFLTYLIPFFITIICSYVCFSFGAMVYLIMPVWEWALIFSILLWYLCNSVYIRHKKL
jgi:hypothetical protein